MTAAMTNLTWAAAAIGADLIGPDCEFTGVGTDTRALQGGELFVALRGPNFDGHDFVAAAEAAGAAALMVERPVDSALPQLLVDDTRLWLGKLGAAWRRRFDIPVVAVTGSNGKTTVKEMLAAILGRRGPVLATAGNLNNDIGVPLTLLRLRPEHEAAVIELGANHAGEIAYLSGLAAPDVALVNNAGRAHLEGFGSLEGVARAKGEIYGGLGKGGRAIINADDAFADLWRGLCAEREVIEFGRHAAVSAVAEADDTGLRLALRTPAGETEVRLPLIGEHNVLNALAATAAALAAGASLTDVRAGLESVHAVRGRLQLRHGRDGARIIDDTYNANPTSLEAGLAALTRFPGRHLLALGDMGELGGDADALHAAAGEGARAAGIDALYGLGEHCRAAVEAFGRGGRHFAASDDLIAALADDLDAEATLLVKGSRSMHMERVVEALAAPGEDR